MNATSFAKTLDRKERERKSSLQWLFSSQANENTVHHISDRRDVGVCINEKKETIAKTGSHPRNDGDGLLGSLLFEQFLSATLCPFLPQFLQGLDIVTAVDMADEFLTERMQAKAKKSDADKRPEFTYFPL